MQVSLKNTLTLNHILSLGFIAALIIISYLVTQFALEAKNDELRVINIAGKQGTLCEKITKLVVMIKNEKEAEDFKKHQTTLQETLILWEQFHKGLQNGDPNLGLPGNNSPQTDLLFQEIAPHFEAIKNQAEITSNLRPTYDTRMKYLLTGALDTVLSHEPTYLEIMDDISLEYDKEGKQRLDWVKTVEFVLTLVTILTLLIVGLFILRPTVIRVNRYVQELTTQKQELEILNQDLQNSEREIRLKTEELRASEEETRQSLEELATINESLKKTSDELRQKNDVLENATEVLDQKNRLIRRNNEQLKEQSQQLEEKNKNITQSIRYAKRIQDAIIPPANLLIEHFQQAFLLFIPRDIVSGDFYWFYQIGNKKVLIVADCTGHGVPGALMTMIGNSLLNEIVNSTQETNPAKILESLDQKLIDTLQKRNDDSKPIHDGMDMAVITIDESKYEIEFASAHNPLYYVRQKEMNRIKGSRFPVGGTQYRSEKIFELHKLKAEPGDVYYLFTDGFQDQQGEEDRRKYMTKRFRNYLAEISHLPMPEQKEKLRTEFENWKGNMDQTDDVLVVGIRV